MQPIQPSRRRISVQKLVVGVILLAFVSPFLWGLGGILKIQLVDPILSKRYLNSVQILPDAKTEATARPNGDILTGNSAPAQVELRPNAPFGELYAKISTTLGQQGFVAGKFSYYGPTNTEINNPEVIFHKKDKYLRVRFVTTEIYQCQQNGARWACGAQTINLEETGINNFNVKLLQVIYDPVNKPNPDQI